MSAKIGSLHADLTMETARFKAGAADAQARMAALKLGITGNSRDIRKAAMDMGLSFTGLARQLSDLQVRYKPLEVATSAYNQQQKVLKLAMDQGIITAKQYDAELHKLSLEMKGMGGGAGAGAAAVNKANGSMSAGIQQLGYNLGDMATMWSLGMKPQQIFASQAGQTTQAIALLAQGTGRFATFMASPWVQAITAGVIALSALAPMLMKTEDAMKDVEQASSGLSDAQSVLGEIFDLTTGKIKNQNEMLRLNAQLMAIQLRAEAMRQRASSQDAMRNFETGNLGLSMGQKALGAIGVPVGDAMDRNAKVRDVLQKYRNGQIDSLIASRMAEKLDFSGLAISKQEFLQAIADNVSAPLKEEMAKKIEDSLATGTLDPVFREEGRKTRERKGPSMETDAQQAADIAALDAEYLRAKLDVTTSADERAELEWQLLAMERDQRLAEIDADKKLTEAQRSQRKAAIERIYGTAPKDGALVVVSNSPAEVKLRREQIAREMQMANDMLGRQADTLQSLADIEPNTRKRAALEAQALDLQQQTQRSLLEQQIANGEIAHADEERALLAIRQLAQRERMRVQAMSPGQRYAYELGRDIQDMNATLENVQVSGLQRLEDELAQVATGTKSVGAAFRDMSTQIIGELARIAIRRAIIEPIASNLFPDKGANDNAAASAGKLITAGGTLTAASAALGVSAATWSATAAQIQAAAASLAASGGGSGGGGLGGIGSLVSGIGSLLGGGGSAPIDVSGLVNNTLSPMPAFANGTKFAPGGLALVGERGPEIVDLPMGSQVIPNHELDSIGGQTTQYVTNYYGPGADEFWSRVDGIASGRANMALIRDRQGQTRKAQRKFGGR